MFKTAVLVLTILIFSCPTGFADESVIRSKAALSAFQKKYRIAAGHKAFAQSSNGRWAWVSNRTSVTYAIEDALERCNRNLKRKEPECRVIHVNEDWIHDISAECDRMRDGEDHLQCLLLTYQIIDDELSDTVRKLKLVLNSAELTAFNEAQQRWITFRNSACSNSDDDQLFLNIECLKRMTFDRSSTLRDRIDECKTAACVPEKF